MVKCIFKKKLKDDNGKVIFTLCNYYIFSDVKCFDCNMNYEEWKKQNQK